MDMRPPPPPPLSLAQQAQQLQSAKFGGFPAPKLPINMGSGAGGNWQASMPGGMTPGMSNGMNPGAMKGGALRPNWGAMQFGGGPVPGSYTPHFGNSPGLQRSNSYGNGSGAYKPGPGAPQVVPPPSGGPPSPVTGVTVPVPQVPQVPVAVPLQYGQFGLPGGRGNQRGAPPPPPPHPNWKPGQPPPPPGPGPPQKPGGTLEAAMQAAAMLGAAGAPGMMEATSAIDFSSKLEDLRRKHPQAWTWKPEELDAWFASGGTSKVVNSGATSSRKANSDAKEAPNKETSAKEPATPRKRSHGEAFGFEIQETLQLQQQLLAGFTEPEFQENLKQLQVQYPERKTKGHYDSMAYFEAFNALAHTVYAKVLPDWKLAPNWDGVREMLSKMQEAMAHPKVKKTQEEINVAMGLPRNVNFTPPSKGSELFLFRPDGDGPVPGYALPMFKDEDGDEAHEFLMEDEETGELKMRVASSLEQVEQATPALPTAPLAATAEEMWYQVVHKPAVMIREQPDEKAKMVGRKKVGKRLRIQSVKDGKWLKLHQSELVKLGVQEAWVVMDPNEAGLPAGAPPLLEKVSSP